MPRTSRHAPFALALLAATCLTPVAPTQAAPGDRLGPEFQVNTATADEQQYPVVAMDADGDFVVAWDRCDLVPDGMGGMICVNSDIFAQRYNAAGEPQGTEFQVNTTTVGEQSVRSAAKDANGDFVVIWSGYGAGDSFGIFAQRFDAAGVAQGAEFRINGLTDDSQGKPSIAMDADGDFVVAWESLNCRDAGCLYDVSTRRFDAAGVPRGDEVQIDIATPQSNKRPAVAMDALGNYVLAWQANDQVAGAWSEGILAQRYNAAGEPQGGVFPVNTTTTDRQQYPSVAMDGDGDFVVTWHGYGTGDDYGVFARRFDAAGDPQGGEFQVNTTTAFSQTFPSIGMDADGDFVVLWRGYGPGDDVGVFAQRYNATGAPQGGEFRVNTTTVGLQGLSYWYGTRVAMNADGDFVAAWQSSDGQDGDGWGIFAQHFDGVERIEGDFDGDGKADLLWRNMATGATVVWLMDGETRLEEGSVGTLPAPWQVAGTGDFNGDGKADILWRNSSTGNAVIWQMNGLAKADSASIGAPPVAWSVEQLRDTDGDGLTDIVWRNDGTGKTVIWRMSGFTRVAAEPIGSVASDWQLR